MVPDVALMLLGGGFVLAVATIWLLLAAPARLRVYAHPNARSSHHQATPTSGGIGFVLPVLGYLAWLGAAQSLPAAAVLAGGAALLAAIGLWDDVREASRRLRLGLQLLAAGGVAWAVLHTGMDTGTAQGGGNAALTAPGGSAGAALWLWTALVAVALTWHVNLYNFMDGIDGLAGVQTLVFAVGAQVVGLGLPGWPGDLLWLTAGSVLGFLVFNWPRARIFMGDVGSYFLGLVTGAVALLLWREATLPLAAALILLAGFWFDATYTLIVRLSTGQAFMQPHRTHLYQKLAAQRGHLWTTLCYLLFAVFWLLPLAWLCSHQRSDGSTQLPWTLLMVLLAVTPLAIAAWRLRAGLPDEPHDQ